MENFQLYLKVRLWFVSITRILENDSIQVKKSKISFEREAAPPSSESDHQSADNHDVIKKRKRSRKSKKAKSKSSTSQVDPFGNIKATELIAKEHAAFVDILKNAMIDEMEETIETRNELEPAVNTSVAIDNHASNDKLDCESHESVAVTVEPQTSLPEASTERNLEKVPSEKGANHIHFSDFNDEEEQESEWPLINQALKKDSIDQIMEKNSTVSPRVIRTEVFLYNPSNATYQGSKRKSPKKTPNRNEQTLAEPAEEMEMEIVPTNDNTSINQENKENDAIDPLQVPLYEKNVPPPVGSVIYFRVTLFLESFNVCKGIVHV